MKKMIFVVLLITTFIIPFASNNCEAKDIWVDHWNYENVDIYVMDETITSGTSNTGKYFKVTVKEVQNGKALKTNEWSFSKYYDDPWRYSTEVMKKRGTTSVVTVHSKIFEYCMKQLDWTYRIKDLRYL